MCKCTRCCLYRRIVEESLELYTCKAAGADTEFPADMGGNSTAPKSYNQLATLMSVPGTVPLAAHVHARLCQGQLRLILSVHAITLHAWSRPHSYDRAVAEM